MRMEGVEGLERPRPGLPLPVQDLGVYERHGGHTLRRHVNVTADDVLHRIVAGGVAGDGLFVDRETAQRCIRSAMNRRADSIRSWLRGRDKGAPYVFDEDMHEVIGRSLTWADVQRGLTVPHPVSGVRLVLRRRSELPGGFTVVTAYPARARRSQR
ncbi:MAG: hypothetical protein JOY68_11340 [Candidatus Dormibacteraeota bacterium]|nr:hypothetical protein [Candidatus Dormibacteraeota bacterium]MBV8445875.1 hypothetical protein [Candidatus Dormibacteraeota bacterium]